MIETFTKNTWEPGADHFKAVIDTNFIHVDSSSVDYYLAEKDTNLYLIFEGSDTKQDWIADFIFFPKKFDIYPGSKIHVHKGISEQYLSIRDKFLDMGYQSHIQNILIAGYSLGGGLSQLACEDAAYHFPNKTVKSISYEGPRVFYGNNDVKKLIKDKQILVKTFWDPVCHLPFVFMGLHDYGTIQWIGKWNRIRPLQHLIPQVTFNLTEKFFGISR